MHCLQGKEAGLLGLIEVHTLTGSPLPIGVWSELEMKQYRVL